MDSVHQRLLQHFLEQDVVGHLELVADDAALGRVRVAIAFADLAGYTRLTEEVGEEEALEVVERFVELVGETLPDDARVIKTIGDEVMVVGTDASALADWAVGLVALSTERPLPRIGVHVGSALYRDGDYYGRAVNLAARVGARATGGEVLVTREVTRGRRAQPVLPADRRGQAQGLRRGDRAVPGGCAVRVLVLLSGGRDSVCLLHRMAGEAERVWALHVNYGLRGAESDGRRGVLPRAVRAARRRAVRRARRCAGRQRAGVGAGRALRRGGAARGRARRADRRRPHRDRPARDRALPARRLAGPAGAARDAGALGPDRAAAAGA